MRERAKSERKLSFFLKISLSLLKAILQIFEEFLMIIAFISLVNCLRLEKAFSHNGMRFMPHHIFDDNVQCDIGDGTRSPHNSNITQGDVLIPKIFNVYTHFGPVKSLTVMTVTGIARFAFSESNITSITMPDSIKTIHYHAFDHCHFLRKIIWSPNIEIIEQCAFANCESITGTVILPSKLIAIKSLAFHRFGTNITLFFHKDLQFIEDNAFSESGITGNLTLLQNLTKLDSSAFKNCRNISGIVVLPPLINRIGDSVFENCENIEKIYFINQSLTKIPDNAFKNCRMLSGRLKLPENVTSIGHNAFCHCSKLTFININPKINFIGKKAFKNCMYLQIHLMFEGKNLKFLGESAFQHCNSISGQLVLPNSITELGNRTFYECSSLTSLTLPIFLTEIPDQCFAWCTGLSQITLPPELLILGDGCFQSCVSINGQLKIPDSVTYIGDNCFRGCSSISGALIIPKSVEAIG